MARVLRRELVKNVWFGGLYALWRHLHDTQHYPQWAAGAGGCRCSCRVLSHAGHVACRRCLLNLLFAPGNFQFNFDYLKERVAEWGAGVQYNAALVDRVASGHKPLGVVTLALDSPERTAVLDLVQRARLVFEERETERGRRVFAFCRDPDASLADLCNMRELASLYMAATVHLAKTREMPLGPFDVFVTVLASADRTVRDFLHGHACGRPNARLGRSPWLWEQGIVLGHPVWVTLKQYLHTGWLV